MVCVAGRGQVVVNGVNLNEVPDMQYILVMAFLDMDGLFSQKLTVWVNYGQKSMNKKNASVTEDGEEKEFGSVVSALNFFYENGWDLHETFLVPQPGTTNLLFYHFLRRKR
jgi:hypothetical protein